MRRPIHILIALCVLSCLATDGFSQNVHQAETFTLNQTLPSNQSHEYTASNYIELKPGFKTEPTGERSTILQLNPYGIFPPETEVTGGANSLDNGVVGTIGGTVSTSAMGGAIYTIPIQLPQGINGMQPSLSVTYNSQGGNGLLGWGWDLPGVSAVTRGGTTLYHDGYMSGVDFDDDRYYLDGQRLMVVNGMTNGANGAEYKTETDGMSKIVSYTCDTTTGPAYFRVWTAEGHVLEYGGTEDSRIGLRQRNDVCVWLLNRVMDSDGNYMTYHYYRSEVGYRLTRIRYTYNESLISVPAYEINLVYQDRPEKEIVFVGNNCLQQTKLLKEINVVYDNDSVLWRYGFNYDETTGLGTRNMYPRLASVEFRCGDQSYNPTMVSWNQQQLEHSLTSLKVDGHFVHHDYSHHEYDDLALIKFTGDFNGDGYSDVVTTWSQNGQKWAYVYLNITNRDGGYWELSKADSLAVDDDLDWIYPGDFNGDGLTDLLFVSRDCESNNYYDFVTLDFHLAHKNANGSISFIPCDPPQSSSYWIWHSKGLSLAMGDFAGNRRNSFVFQTTETSKQTRKHYHIYYDDATGKMRQTSIGGVDVNAERVQAADFDGDGITELWYCQTDGDVTEGKIVRLDGNGDFETVNASILTRYHKVFPGDFNGDGKADFLTFATDGNGGGTWQINLSKGNGLFWPQYDITDQMGIGDPGDHGFSMRSRFQQTYQFKMVGLADFNGDGKTDIATVKDGGLPLDSLVILYAPFGTQGCAYRQTVPKSSTDIGTGCEYSCVSGNFLGKENTALFSDDDVFSVTPLSDRYTVSCITDGMGNGTHLEYGYLMPTHGSPDPNDYYRMDDRLQDPVAKVFSIALPVKGLKKVWEYNAGGGISSVSYQYEGALAHNGGKGFLGFTKKTSTAKHASAVQQKTVTCGDLSMLQPFPAMVPLCDSVFSSSGHLVSLTQYSFVPYVNNRDAQGKVFMPVMDSKTVKAYDLDSHSFLTKTREMNQYQTDTQNGTDGYANAVKRTSSWRGVTGDDSVSECEDYAFQEVETTQYRNDQVGSWILNRPQSTLSRRFRPGDQDTVSGCVNYYYYTDKPRRVRYVMDLPNDGHDTFDSLALLTEYGYDGFGRVVSETVTAPNDGSVPGRTTTREYGGAYGYRFMTRETLPMGYSSSYTYDAHYGFLTSETDCNGRTTRYVRDPLGITVWTHFPDSTRSCSAIRWNGHSGYYVWSKTSGHPSGTVYYGKKGNKTGATTQGLKGRTILTDTEYDQQGRIARESLPYYDGDTIRWTGFTYDGYGRTIRKDLPDGTVEEFLYDGLTTGHVVRPVSGTTRETSGRVNAAGWTVWSKEKLDGGGENTVGYGHYADGSLAWAEVNGQSATRDSLGYDRRGNRVLLKDPDYGITRSSYNALGELVGETNPKGFVTAYVYDSLGRMVSRAVRDGNVVIESTGWVYDETSGRKGLLSSVSHDNQAESYTYDNLLRLVSVTNTIGGVSYATTYTYDSLSRPLTVTYPSGISVLHRYRPNGYALGDQDPSTGDFLWRLDEDNAAGQPTALRYGDALAVSFGYDDKTGRLTNAKTVASGHRIVDLVYGYDALGNLASRTDRLLNHGVGITETFAYDRLDRLVTDSLDGVPKGRMQYDVFGRILEKQADGQTVFSATPVSYDMGDRPHALRSAYVPSGVLPAMAQTIDYTPFDKVLKVKQGNDSLCYTYGYDRQRIAMEEHVGNTIRTKRYVGNCEFVSESSGNVTTQNWLTYLTGPTGVYAVVETSGNTSMLHYVLKDNLGSWTTITDSDGSVEQRLSYDAWGNLRNPETWGGSFTGTPMFDRGFTGHEHLTAFGLINMNGRMYDPMMSSFLSVDQYVQNPSSSQNFNRYAYCLNNPLRYVDPSGEVLWEAIVVGAIIGAFSNTAMQVMSGNVNNSGQFWIAAGIGAISGGLGGAFGYQVGYGMNVLLNGAEGFWLGSLAGATSGFAGGFVGSSTAAWMQGATFSQGFWAGMESGGWGALAGWALGGLEAGYYSKQCGGDFWTGEGITYTRTNPSFDESWEEEIDKRLTYSNEYLKEFSEENGLYNPRNLVDSYADGSCPDGWHQKGSYFTDDDITKAYAVTRNIGFGKYNSYYAPAAFVSPEELYLTIVHEHLHLQLFSLGYTLKSQEDFHHASISRFEYDQAKLWNYRVDYYYYNYMKYYNNYIYTSGSN